MADLGAKARLGDDNSGTLDAIVNESSTGGMAVDVIKTLREISGDLHPGNPRGEWSEFRVSRVTEAGGEGGPRCKVVDKVDMVGGEGGAEESDEASVVAFAD